MGIGAIPIGLLGLLLLSLCIGMGVRRREFELRMRVLELLALSTRRGVAVVPMLRRSAMEGRRSERRALTSLAQDLESGEELGEALHWAAPNSFPAHVRASIEAAQGGAALPGVLDGLAAETDESMGTSHRLAVAFLYPLILLFALLAVRELVVAIYVSGLGLSVTPVLGTWTLADWIPQAGPMRSPVLTLALGVTLGLLLAHTLWRSRPKLRRFVRGLREQMAWLLGRWGQRDLVLSRFLVTLSHAVEAGTPLPEGVRCAAAAAGDERMRERLVRTADGLAAGQSMHDAWQQAQLPESVAVRVAAACHGDAAQCASSLRQVARGRRLRFVQTRERVLEALQPASILLFGTILALDFVAIMSVTSLIGEDYGLW